MKMRPDGRGGVQSGKRAASRFGVSGQAQNSRAAQETGGDIPVKWKRRKRQPDTMDEQNQAFDQHQGAKPGNGGVKFPGPDHQDKIPASDQGKRPGGHAQPVIQHWIIRDRLCAQTLQQFRGLRPAHKNADRRNAPCQSGESQKQFQQSESQVHGWWEYFAGS